MVAKERWAVSKKDGFVTYYWSPYRIAVTSPWTRDLALIAWWDDKPSAERSFGHSQWVPVRESDVIADLVGEALSK